MPLASDASLSHCGAQSQEGDAASSLSREIGLELDATYTAKAFAALLDVTRGRKPAPFARKAPLHVVYWHTLSARPFEPLLTGAPELTRELTAWCERACIA